MDWISIGGRIRRQREFLGITREQFAEKLDITPKFCSDIELGIKGMSVTTLCKIADALSLSADYILFGKNSGGNQACGLDAIAPMLESLTANQLPYIEEVLKTVIQAMNYREEN